jgi:hypothetical protein
METFRDPGLVVDPAPVTAAAGAEDSDSSAANSERSAARSTPAVWI